MIETNPYNSGKGLGTVATHAETQESNSLRRGLAALVGMGYGGFAAAAFAYLLLWWAITRQWTTWLDVGGVYPEMALIYVLIGAIPGGMLGGLVCGVARGRRLGLALALASAVPLMLLIAGVISRIAILDILFFSLILFLSAVGSTLFCHWLIQRILRRRRIVFAAMESETIASPGANVVFLNGVLAAGILVGVAAMLSMSGRPANYVAGLTTGFAFFGTWGSLYLSAAYPNRARVTAIQTVIFLAAFCFSLGWANYVK